MVSYRKRLFSDKSEGPRVLSLYPKSITGSIDEFFIIVFENIFKVVIQISDHQMFFYLFYFMNLNSKFEQSAVYTFDKHYSKSLQYNSDQIVNVPCACQHCQKDTKPLQQPQPQPITALNSRKYGLSQGYIYLLTLLINMKGRLSIPDIYVPGTGNIFYFSENGRIRCKQKQNNLDVIRHFDEKRKRMQPKLNTTFAKIQKQKDAGLIFYRDQSAQLVTDTAIGKHLSKRKNDPAWLDTVMLMLLPNTKRTMHQYTPYYYKANKQNRKQLEAHMKNMSDIIDTQQYKTMVKIQGINTNITSLSASLGITWSNSFQDNQNFYFLKQQQQAKQITYDLVSYIEIVCKIRIVHGTFYYLVDADGRYNFMKIQGLICGEVDSKELQLFHDRFKPMQTIGNQQLKNLKQQLYYRQIEKLWQICISTLIDCLDQRKRQLKIETYKKPENGQLKNMFIKLIPEFKTEQIFQNHNWRNDLPLKMFEYRAKINKIIREDQGIRILKRFGIIFYRTFN